jgi:hypothetical protein
MVNSKDMFPDDAKDFSLPPNDDGNDDDQTAVTVVEEEAIPF